MNMNKKNTLTYKGIRILLWVVLIFVELYAGRTEAQSRKQKPMKALSPSQALVDIGNQAPLIRYNRHIPGGGHTDGGSTGGWQIIHSLAAWAGNTSADEKLLRQIAFNFEGENTITAKGGYPCQHERHMTGTYAILRHSPRFWKGKLTQQDRHKIDLIMKASLVASAYTTADASYANGAKPTAIDGDTNLNRAWNPNYREGMIGALLVATVYYGKVEDVYKILDNYNHTAFVGQLKEAGLYNIHETFTWKANHPESGAPTGEQIEKNIRNYRFDGKTLQEPMEIYYQLTKHTYGRNVNCGLNGGSGIEVEGVPTGTLVKGCDNIPNMGKPGMLLEFDGVDAGGPRSSIGYAYDGFRPNLTNHVVLLAGGAWKPGPKADELIGLLDVGITDVVYKLENGYRNYSKGRGSKDIADIHQENRSWSYRTTIPLWKDVVRPFHVGK